MANHGRVARLDPGDQRCFMDPAVRERVGAIKIDPAGRRAFRDHPDLAVTLQQERIREMPRFLEHGLRWTLRPVFAERNDRDDTLAVPMIEILDEQIGAAVMHEGKWIGIEAEAGIRHHVPRRSLKRACVPEVRSVYEAPARPPMW